LVCFSLKEVLVTRLGSSSKSMLKKPLLLEKEYPCSSKENPDPKCCSKKESLENGRSSIYLALSHPIAKRRDFLP